MNVIPSKTVETGLNEFKMFNQWKQREKTFESRNSSSSNSWNSKFKINRRSHGNSLGKISLGSKKGMKLFNSSLEEAKKNSDSSF